MFAKMWNDDAGVVGFEYLLVATIVALSLIVGLAAVSTALNAELVELAQAIVGLCQGYSYTGISTCLSSKCGSAGSDTNGTVTWGTYAPTPVVISATVCP